MEKVGVEVGRKRKPFMEKSTNIFIDFTNPQIEDMLKHFNIDYEIPEEIWETETINKLKVELKQILLNNIINCKKID